MILRTLELHSFGRFIDQSYEFRRGMNLVIGPNEAGKSTMMEAIPAVLFGCKDKKRFRPWARNVHCSAKLILENKHSNISLARDIDSDLVDLSQSDDLYNEQDSFHSRVVTGEHSERKIEYTLYLKKFFGLSDERLFRASLFLGQGDFPSNAQDISNQLRTLLSGFACGDSDVVLKSLQDDYLAITNDNPWSEHKTSSRELEAVQDALDAIHSQKVQLQQLKIQMPQLQQQIADIKVQLSQDKHDYSQGVEYLHWLQHQWQSQDYDPCEPVAADEYKSVQNKIIVANAGSDLELELQQLEKTLVDANLPVEIPESLPHLLAEADDIRCALVALQQRMIPLRKAQNALVFPHWWRWSMISLLLVLFVVGGSYYLPQWSKFASLFIGAVLVAMWSWLVLCARIKGKQKKDLQQQLAELELLREEDRSRLQSVDDQFEKFGFSSSAVEMVKMKKQLEAHEHILCRLSEVRHALNAGEDGDPSRPKELMVQHNPLGSEHLQPHDLPEAEDKLAQLKKKIDTSELELMTLQRNQALLQERLDALDNIEIKEQRLCQEATELLEKKAVLECAYGVLNNATTQFYQTNVCLLEEEISHYLTKITLGKYSTVKIGENYTIRIRQAGQRGRGRALENLSRGTIDLVCLAIRVALTRFLTSNEFLPFFLDDALVNLDTKRLHETVAALEVLSAEHQIVMFTHDERLYKLASRRRWHIVSLGSRRVGNVIKKKNRENENDRQLSLL